MSVVIPTNELLNYYLKKIMFNTKQINALNKAVLELSKKLNSLGSDVLSDYKDFEIVEKEDDDGDSFYGKSFYGKSLFGMNIRYTGNCLDKKIEALQTDINHTNRVLKALMNYLNLDSEFVEKAEWEVKPKKAKKLAKKEKKK